MSLGHHQDEGELTAPERGEKFELLDKNELTPRPLLFHELVGIGVTVQLVEVSGS